MHLGSDLTLNLKFSSSKPVTLDMLSSQLFFNTEQLILVLFAYLFLDTPSRAEGLLLALHSVQIPGSVQGTI